MGSGFHPESSGQVERFNQLLEQTLCCIVQAAYELRLPDSWSMHPVFHISLLKPWRASEWSSPVDLQPDDIETAVKPTSVVEKNTQMAQGANRKKEDPGVFWLLGMIIH